jgi:hypothetical protein
MPVDRPSNTCIRYVRILREHERERDVAPTIVRPALEDGKLVERAIAADNFLARRILDRPRHQIAQTIDHGEHPERIEHAAGDFRRRELFDLPREVVQAAYAERHADALHRAEQVDRDGNIEARRTFEEQRGPAAGRLRHAVRQRADLQIGADRIRNPRQLSLDVERGNEFVEIAEHNYVLGAECKVLHVGCATC